MNQEIESDVTALPCVKQTACGKLLNSTGSSAGALLAWRGGMGEVRGRLKGEGIYVYIYR